MGAARMSAKVRLSPPRLADVLSASDGPQSLPILAHVSMSAKPPRNTRAGRGAGIGTPGQSGDCPPRFPCCGTVSRPCHNTGPMSARGAIPRGRAGRECEFAGRRISLASGRERPFADQELPQFDPVLLINAERDDGCPTDGGSAHKHRPVPAEAPPPAMAARVEQTNDLAGSRVAAGQVRTFVKVAEGTITLPLKASGLDPGRPIR